MAPGLGDDPRRRDLAGHAPLGQPAQPVAGQSGHGRVDPRHCKQPRRGGVGRMTVEQPLDVGEEHEQGRAQQRGHERCQAVVVAEGCPQFLHADRVVLVDDRDRSVVEQRAERVADIEVAGPILEIIGHQQHLRGVPALGAEHPLVGLDQTALADRRHGLQVGQFLGPLGQAHPPHAGPNGAGTDEHDPPPLVQDGVELAAERLDPRIIQQSIGAGEHAGADLDDDQGGGGGEVRTELVSHGPMVRGANRMFPWARIVPLAGEGRPQRRPATAVTPVKTAACRKSPHVRAAG